MLMMPVLLQWQLIDRIYEWVTYYAIEAWFDIARDCASILLRLYMGG